MLKDPEMLMKKLKECYNLKKINVDPSYKYTCAFIEWKNFKWCDTFDS